MSDESSKRDEDEAERRKAVLEKVVIYQSLEEQTEEMKKSLASLPKGHQWFRPSEEEKETAD